jgi:glutamine---fructose-6-phosphate transaminase (isomerizing)
MNLNDSKYSQFAICHEMRETVDIVRNFRQSVSEKFLPYIRKKRKIFLTGEGSSRIFPAKHLIYRTLIHNSIVDVKTEGALQAQEYNLSNYAVLGLSNSGKTYELIQLFQNLKNNCHDAFFGITANTGTPTETLPVKSILLNCGKEKAVPATKSVVEQALILESLLYNYLDITMPDLNDLADKILKTLQINIEKQIIETISNSSIIYFAGKNNGVAEEITLKTNEIIHKKSIFLEGTYALHGIEEVMQKGEVLIIFDPYPSEEEKYQKFLIERAGIKVIAISTHQTRFPTIIIPDGKSYSNYIELVAGWNLLVDTGIYMNVNLDKPERARKIGNEG